MMLVSDKMPACLPVGLACIAHGVTHLDVLPGKKVKSIAGFDVVVRGVIRRRNGNALRMVVSRADALLLGRASM